VTLLQKKWLTFGSVVLFVVLLDQWSKLMVRTRWELQNMELIPGWLSFHYTKNPGMALGIDILSTFQISVVALIATIAITVYIVRMFDTAPIRFIVLMGLVIGGAVGNLIDRIFIARIMEYGGFLEGQVVDFIHFTLRINDWPVFPYIFNVADMAISCALILFIVFNRKFVPQDEVPGDTADTPGEAAPAVPKEDAGT